MSYQVVFQDLIHRARVDTRNVDVALPDGDVYGVHMACNPYGNGLVVPITKLYNSATVTCLECLAASR